MKASASTGLVSAIIIEPFRGYQPGARVGFSPNDFERYRSAGLVKEAEASGETVTIKPPAPTLDASQILPQSLPAIPQDWETLHQLQRLRLAVQVSGRPVVKIGEADKIIREEIERRAGA